MRKTSVSGGDRKSLRRRASSHGRSRHRRAKRDRALRRRIVITWSVMLVVVTLGVVGFFVSSWMRSTLESGPRKAVAPPKAGRAGPERIASKFPSPSPGVAIALVEQAMRVEDDAGIATHFRIGTTPRDQMLDFLRSFRDGHPDKFKCRWLGSLDANGLLIEGVMIVADFNQRLALLTPDDQGTWRVDFDSLARVCTPAWPEILKGPGFQEAVVRVVLSPDNYFNGRFHDETQWICLAMASADQEVPVYGYVAVNTPQAIALQRIMLRVSARGSAGALPRAVLRIRRPEEAELLQFEIVQVLAEDWILTDRPFDGIVE